MGKLAEAVVGIAAAIPSPIQPFAAAGEAVLGAVDASNQQRAQRDAANVAEQNQYGALSQAQLLAKQQAEGPSFQSLLDAQRGGVATLKSEIGGVPNIGALIKQLFGGNIESAIGASLQQRNANLTGASNTLLESGRQFGWNTSVPNQPNPYSNAATSVFGALSNLGKKPNTGGTGASWSPGNPAPTASDLPYPTPPPIVPPGG